jgi:hypothetical protein
MTTITLPKYEGPTLWDSAKTSLVPTISDCQLESMSRQIRPLIKIDGWYWTIKGERHLRNQSYLWDAEPEAKMFPPSILDQIEIMTFHTWGAPVFFKPSIAEVMGCIGRFVPDYSLVRYFYLESHDMGPGNVIGNCHWCRCKLFGGSVIPFVEGRNER